MPLVDGAGNVVLGALFSLVMQHYDNDPFISIVINYLVGIVAIPLFNQAVNVPLYHITAKQWRWKEPIQLMPFVPREERRTKQWWMYAGGIFQVAYSLAIAIFVAHLGYVLTFAAMNLGCIAGGLVTDRLVAKRVISVKEVCAVLVSIAGVLIVSMANVIEGSG